MCLLASCIFDMEKRQFKPSAHFKIGLSLFLLSYRSSSYIPDTSPLSNTWLANISFQSVGYFFIFLIVSFDAHIFNCDKFSSFACVFGIITKKPLPNPRWWQCMPMFSSNSFVLALVFRPFELSLFIKNACPDDVRCHLSHTPFHPRGFGSISVLSILFYPICAFSTMLF